MTGWRRTPIWNRRRWRAINSSWATCGSATAPMPGWGRGSASTRARPVRPRAIVAELRALANRDAALSASVLLEGVDAPERAQAALAAAFDDPAVAELAVYTLGDGGAMAGLLVAGQRQDRGAIFLVFLMD